VEQAMPDNRAGTYSSIFGIGATGIGVGSYGAGQGLLYTFPNAVGNVAPYPSLLTGNTDIDPAYIANAKAQGMTFGDVRPYTPHLQPGETGYSINDLSNRGNSTMAAEANTLRAEYGPNGIGEIKIDFGGKGLDGKKYIQSKYTYNDGTSFRPDLHYPTYSPQDGRTLHFDEVKGVDYLNNSKYGSQLSGYGKALAEVNSQSAYYRGAADGLRNFGKVAVGLDGIVTAYSAVRDVLSEKYASAGLYVAEFGGRYTAANLEVLLLVRLQEEQSLEKLEQLAEALWHQGQVQLPLA
jgi:hypothetical protein